MEKVKETTEAKLMKVAKIFLTISRIQERRIKSLEAICGVENVEKKNNIKIPGNPDNNGRNKIRFQKGSNPIYDSPEFRKGDEYIKSPDSAKVPGDS
jgi:hypothetical protein